MTSGADPIKLIFFASKELLTFFSGKLACLLHRGKNNDSEMT